MGSVRSKQQRFLIFSVIQVNALLLFAASTSSANSQTSPNRLLAPYVGVWETSNKGIGGIDSVVPSLMQIKADGSVEMLFVGDSRIIAPDRLEYSEDFSSFYFVYDPMGKEEDERVLGHYPYVKEVISPGHLEMVTKYFYPTFIDVSPLLEDEISSRFQILTPGFRGDPHFEKPAPFQYLTTLYGWLSRIKDDQVSKRKDDLSKIKSFQQIFQPPVTRRTNR